MRKRIIPQNTESTSAADWLNPAEIAQVEVTSEEEARPIESALLLNEGPGWVAGNPGPQLIRLIFDFPQQLRRIRLAFREEYSERTQEFVLRWTARTGGRYQEIVRQQYTFAPPNTVSEVEEYQVELEAAEIELSINPNVADGSAKASLESLRLA